MDALALLLAASLHRQPLEFPAIVGQAPIILVAGNARTGFQRVRGGPTDLPPDVDPPVADPAADAGPVTAPTYVIADLGGTPRYVSTTGVATTVCSFASPCSTFAQANSAAVAGDPIIYRVGTYRNVGNFWSGTAWSTEPQIAKAGIQWHNYPGETVIFDGSQDLTAGFTTTETVYKYAAYTPLPCGNGFGITLCTDGLLDNVNGTTTTAPFNVGKWPDQVWVDNVEFQEVATKAAVTPTTFFVDRTNNRLYLLASVVSGATEIDASNRGDFVSVFGTDVTWDGFKIRRYSNSPARAAVVDISFIADRFHMKNVTIEDSSMISLFLQGTTTDPLDDTVIEDSAITGSNWMGINTIYARHLMVRHNRITGLDRWNEFSSSPQAGGIKTAKACGITITRNFIANNRSQGVWLDQSNIPCDGAPARVLSNSILNNGDAGEDTALFFEISEGAQIINNRITCPISTCLKIAGSTGVTIRNNSVHGGGNTFGIYADARSQATCDVNGKITPPGTADCAGTPSSDRWAATWLAKPNTLDWRTRVDTIVGNKFSYPNSATPGQCNNVTTAVCIQRNNNTPPQAAVLTLNSMLHVAEPARSIPQTVIDCNAYASDFSLITVSDPTNSALVNSYATAAAFSTAMAGAAPYPALTFDAHSVSGAAYINHDGSSTALLTDPTDAACAFPTDAALNGEVPAGTKHFGATYD